MPKHFKRTRRRKPSSGNYGKRSTSRFNVGFSKKYAGKVFRDPSFPTSSAPIYRTRTGVAMKKKLRGDWR